MRWSFWPVSITLHVALAIAAFIVPLMAEVAPPDTGTDAHTICADENSAGSPRPLSRRHLACEPRHR